MEILVLWLYFVELLYIARAPEMADRIPIQYLLYVLLLHRTQDVQSDSLQS